MMPRTVGTWELNALRGAVLLSAGSLLGILVWTGCATLRTPDPAPRVLRTPSREAEEQSQPHPIVVIPEVEPEESPAPTATVETMAPPPSTNSPAVPVVPVKRAEFSKPARLKVVVAEVNRSAAQRAGAAVNLPREATCLERDPAARALDWLRSAKCAQTLAEGMLAWSEGEAIVCDAIGQLEVPGSTVTIPLGVRLSVTATTLDQGRLRLAVAANLHDTPGLQPQGFSATLNLSAGQTLVIADLLPVLVRGGGDVREVVLLITPE